MIRATDIILFRFSSWTQRTREMYDLLRRLNRGTLIIGLWSGTTPTPDAFPTYFLRGELDRQLVAWFNTAGNQLPWERLLVVSSNTLFAAPLVEFYAPRTGDVFLPSLCQASEVPASCSDWSSAELSTMRTWAKRQGVNTPLRATLPVAGAFPRAFLEWLATYHYPEVATAALRLPLLAQLSGCNLRSAPTCAPEQPFTDRFFGHAGPTPTRDELMAELDKAHGRRAFYPHDDSLDWLLKQVNAFSEEVTK